MKVSIVVPAHDTEETLDACLRAILAAVEETRGEDHEVVVVDDGSRDDTARIALAHPVRLVRLPENQGRIRAREEGVRAARAERVLLVDSRVLVPPDCLLVLDELDYEPVMGRVDATRERESEGWNRLLFLIRKKIYRPYYPVHGLFPEILVTPENFDRVPKGLGFFFVSRRRFLEALPERRSHHVSDDTRLLEKIVAQREILATDKLVVDYLPRTDRAESFRHLFERGPRFADFHLRPGMKYYPVWVMGWIATAAAVAAAFLAPAATGVALAVLALLVLALGAYLAERPGETFRVTLMLPVLAGIFGLGILHGKFYRFLRAPPRSWNRRVLLASVFIAGILFYALQRRAFADVSSIRWPLLALLSLLHLLFLAVNGLVLRSFLEPFGLELEPQEWFGLASVTAMSSYLASGAGGLLTRAAILKHRFRLDYPRFLAVLSANYALNAMLAAILGLLLYGVCFPRRAVEAWQVPAFLGVVASTTAVLWLVRPKLPLRLSFAAELLGPVYEGWEILAANRWVLVKVTALLGANLVLSALTLMTGFAVLSRSVPPEAALLVAALSSFSIFVAVTPANLGVQEGITASVAYVIGYGFHDALAAATVSRAVAMVDIFVLGPVFGYLLLRRGRRLRRWRSGPTPDRSLRAAPGTR